MKDKDTKDIQKKKFPYETFKNLSSLNEMTAPISCAYCDSDEITTGFEEVLVSVKLNETVFCLSRIYLCLTCYNFLKENPIEKKFEVNFFDFPKKNLGPAELKSYLNNIIDKKDPQGNK